MVDESGNKTQETPSPAVPTEHYEEVAEYRIGEGSPPLPLIICFVIIVIWAMISWIPFLDIERADPNEEINRNLTNTYNNNSHWLQSGSHA